MRFFVMFVTAVCVLFLNNNSNRIYNKNLDRDWFSARLFCHVIGARSRGCPITGVCFELFQIGYL